MGVTVTGLNAERMLEIEAASIVEATLVGNNLVLRNHAGDIVLNASVRGATGPAGPAGPAGDVASGGYVGTLQDAVTEVLAANSLSGLGLVHMAEYSATDLVKSGVDDSFHTVDNVSAVYDFQPGRSYVVDFGIHIVFGAWSTIDNIISLDLREGSTTLRRVTIPGDTESHSAGIVGRHVIKSCPWDGTKTLTMRAQKRTGANFTIKNTEVPSYISITDLGSRFAV